MTRIPDKDRAEAQEMYEELAGYTLFKESGCVACHNGEGVGGNMFQKMGIVEPYQATTDAEGRSAVTGKDSDRFSFKVTVRPAYALTSRLARAVHALSLYEAKPEIVLASITWSLPSLSTS